jgi:uncharacterized membrane protein YkvA (DUF1232 family)
VTTPEATNQPGRSSAANFEDEKLLERRSSRPHAKTWREQAEILRREVTVIWFVCKDSRTPWYARVVAACAVGYIFSPIQLIPSFIPLIGFLDDFLILSLGFYLTRWLVPGAVMRACRERAAAAGKRTDQSVPAVVGKTGALVMAAIWLLLMAAGAIWLYKPSR